ncbi:MAG: hypothetical protein P9X24_11965 [Candidatus Hatepunaea meridiana]|nr:hypothetical protein [Candidatus Hatepunaea meridiana]
MLKIIWLCCQPQSGYAGIPNIVIPDLIQNPLLTTTYWIPDQVRNDKLEKNPIPVHPAVD